MIITETLLVAYADGELSGETAQKMEQHLAADPAARRQVAMYRETAMLLRTACGESFYAESAREVRPTHRPASRRPFRRPLGWAMAASIAAAIIGFGGGTMWLGEPTSERAELLNEIADYHPVYARETRHLVEVSVDHADEITAWLGQRLDRVLAVPDLTADGLHFAGARMLVANGRPVAQLMYTREYGLPIGVCLTRMDGSGEPVTVEQRGDLRLASWQSDGYAYVVVGELDERQARSIADHAERQLKI